MHGKIKTSLHLLDDKKVSESFAQIAAQKYKLGTPPVGKRISKAHDAEGKIEPAAFPFSSLWVLATLLHTDHPWLWF